jgi:hypothetical protein
MFVENIDGHNTMRGGRIALIASYPYVPASWNQLETTYLQIQTQYMKRVDTICWFACPFRIVSEQFAKHICSIGLPESPRLSW